MLSKRCLFWVPVFLAALGSLLRPPGPSGCPSRPLPAPSWGCFGAILGHLGATLGFSCASLARLGAHFAPFLPHHGANSGHFGSQVVCLSLPILLRPGSTCRFSFHVPAHLGFIGPFLRKPVFQPQVPSSWNRWSDNTTASQEVLLHAWCPVHGIGGVIIGARKCL